MSMVKNTAWPCNPYSIHERGCWKGWGSCVAYISWCWPSWVGVEESCSSLMGVEELRVQTFCLGETRVLPWWMPKGRLIRGGVEECGEGPNAWGCIKEDLVSMGLGRLCVWRVVAGFTGSICMASWPSSCANCRGDVEEEYWLGLVFEIKGLVIVGEGLNGNKNSKVAWGGNFDRHVAVTLQ